MIDPRILRDQPELVIQGIANRQGQTEWVDRLIDCDTQWRKSLTELDALKNQRNLSTPKGKPTPDEQTTLRQLSDTIKTLQETVSCLESTRHTHMMQLPNIPHPSVPIGASEEQNVVIKTVGSPPVFSFPPQPHDRIASRKGWIDFEAGTRMTGSRFSVYKGAGARLERALISMMLDQHTENGYTEYWPPAIVHRTSLEGTGQLPKFEDDLFALSDTDYFLSPTAEVQLTNLYRDHVIPSQDLPIKMVAYAPCFRKEAGSYGRDLAGIIRQHQFNKVELVKIVHPDQAPEALMAMLNDAEGILQALELPYRVVQLCTGDLGFSAAITYDIEVWFPSQGKYREISSVSHFGDFQARRSMIRFKSSESDQVGYAHTLNGSGLAVGRTLAAILENFQTSDGAVQIPAVLSRFFNHNLSGVWVL